jgi:hypothetical protein
MPYFKGFEASSVWVRFELTTEAFANFCDIKLGWSPQTPPRFTEHGAIEAATILNSLARSK